MAGKIWIKRGVRSHDRNIQRSEINFDTGHYSPFAGEFIYLVVCHGVARLIASLTAGLRIVWNRDVIKFYCPSRDASACLSATPAFYIIYLVIVRPARLISRKFIYSLFI